MKVLHFFFLLAILSICAANVQELKAQNTTPFFLTQSKPGEGAHENANWHLLQDKNGNIWTLTSNGICKSDGDAFTSPSILTEGLIDPAYTKAVKGYDGKIWFVGFSGKLVFYENRSFHAFEHGSAVEQYLSSDKCVSLHVDSSNALHLGTFKNGYFKILPNGEVLHLVKGEKDPSGIYFTKIEGSHFVFGVAHSSHMNFHFPLFSYGSDGNYHDVGKLYDDTILAQKENYLRIRYASFSNGDLVISRNHRLAIIRNDSVQIHKTNAPMTGLMIDRNDGIWLSGLKTKGVLYYPNSQLTHENEQNFLPHTTVHHMIEDMDGSIWFGTDTSGVMHIPFPEFGKLKMQKLSSYKATERLDLIRNAKAILNGAKKSGCFRVYNGKELIELTVNTENRVTKQYYDEKNNTLLLGAGTSLITINTKIPGEKAERNIEFKGRVRSICPKYNGQGLWISAGRAVYSFNYDDYVKVPEPLLFEVTQLCETDSFLFAATPNGLWKWEKNEWTQVKDKMGHLDGQISHIRWYKEKLWIFSYKNGLTVYADGVFHNVPDNYGIDFHSVYGSYANDTALEILASNGRYTAIMPLKDHEFCRTLIPTPHLFGHHSVQSIHHIGQQVLFSSVGDVFLYSPGKMAILPTVRMTIDKIVVNGRPRPFTSKLTLPHDSNTITLHFSARSYHSKGEVGYMHRMSGINNWTSTEQKSLRYTTLEKGEHTFQVHTLNSFCQFTQNQTVNITILPPYYQTWWFRTGIGTLIGLLIFTGVKLRIERIKKKGALLEELHGSQYQALAARMNPHFLFNSLSAIHEFTLNNAKEVSAEYISDYALLMRMVLENSAQNVVSLKTELETISLYLKMENLRCEGKINYSLDIDEAVNVHQTEIPTALLQPYIENAVWHGLAPKKNGRAELTLKIEKDGKGLLLSIEDNGIGRKASAQLGTSNHMGFDSQGTDITEKRIQLMNSLYGSRITVETMDLVENDGQPRGTLVRIRIPT